MAISNFKIPTGLEVSGATAITGTVDIAGALTASSGLSSSRGDYTSLFINNVAVAAGGVGAAEVSGAITGALASYDSNVSGAITASLTNIPTRNEVSGAITASLTNVPTRSEVSGVLTASYAQLGVTNTFTAAQVITGGLSMTGDLSAQSASLTGDLTVNGNLTVKGVTTSIDSTTVNIGDKNINLGTGSAVLSVLDGGGLDLGTSANVQWRYDNANSSWTSNVGVNVTGALPAVKLAGVSALTRIAGANALVNSTFGSVSISSTSVTTVSGALTASVIAPTITVGSPLSTSASLNAANAVTVGSVSTLATAMNGATTTVVGVNGLFLSGANVYVTGATYHDSNVSGTTAQFTTVTGSNISSSVVYAGSLVAPSTNVVTVTAAGTSTLDTFQVATYGGAKYLVKAKDATTAHTMEALVSADGTVAQLTPYASTYTGVSLFSLSASNDGTTATISIISAANALTASVFKTYLP